MKSFIISLTLLCSAMIYSQQEASNWYFGYGAGIKFNPSGTVSSVNDGRLETNEGSASISDQQGNLLFYTDGRTIYNRQNTVMSNGSGLFGDFSSTQSAIIVPNPKVDNIYYVFTVDNPLDGRNFGLNYSIIDMEKGNGFGAVTVKNVLLLQYSSEKITAVRKDCITGNYWVLTLSTLNGEEGPNNTYHAYEVSEDGVSTNSVKSTFSIGRQNRRFSDSRGYLTFSPDGSRLASANMQNGLYLYDFDTATGIVSKQQNLSLDPRAAYAYGAAFSPNNDFLYIHSSNDFFQRNAQDNPSDHFSILTQFNLQSNDIGSSAYIVDAQQLYRGGLQLGPNGKIYRALSVSYTIGFPYLGVINNPNMAGEACDYQHNAINLSPNRSSQGLPPFIQSIFNTEIDIINNGRNSSILNLCENDTYKLVADVVPDATYTWTRDGVDLNLDSNELIIDRAGHYEVYVDPNGGVCLLEGEAFVEVKPLPQVADTILKQCDIDANDGLTVYNLEEAYTELIEDNPSYEVSFYTSLQNIDSDFERINSEEYYNLSNPQTLYVKVNDRGSGCFSVATLKLESSPGSIEKTELNICDTDGNNDGFHEFDLQNTDSMIPTGVETEQNNSFYRTSTDALLKRNSLPFNYVNNEPGGEIIYRRTDNGTACVEITEMQLRVNYVPNIITEAKDIYCLNSFPQSITLDAGLDNGTQSSFLYEWSNGENTPTINVNEPGIYQVKVYNNLGCFSERRIIVEPSDIAKITDISVTDASDNNSISVFVSGAGDFEYGLDSNTVFQDENFFNSVSPGLHTLFIRDKNDCGIVERVVSVIGFPKYFTPNGDGFNDLWQVKGLNNDFQPASLIFIYDRYGKLLKKLDPLSKGWDGKFNNEVLPSSDYWFSVLLEDGRLFTDHFSLRR